MQVGVIVPAFNEGPRLAGVLEVLTSVPWLGRIVVVDDGSGDRTAEVARRFPVLVVQHSHNRGKGAALQTGLSHQKDADIVFFLDADLVGLQEPHLRALLEPLLRDPAVGMCVGTFCKGRWHVDLQQRWFSILNGQRALSRRFLDRLPDLSWSGYGVEVLLSTFAAHAQVRVAEAKLPGLTHVLKEEKFGLLKGLRLRLKMYAEVLRALAVCRRLYPVTRPKPIFPEPPPPPDERPEGFSPELPL